MSSAIAALDPRTSLQEWLDCLLSCCYRIFDLILIGKEGKMPKIFEKDGFKFFFYSNEHEPIHVHVWLGGGEAVFVVSPEDVELRSSINMKVGDLSRARQLVIENQGLIQEKWNEFFK